MLIVDFHETLYVKYNLVLSEWKEKNMLAEVSCVFQQQENGKSEWNKVDNWKL